MHAVTFLFEYWRSAQPVFAKTGGGGLNISGSLNYEKTAPGIRSKSSIGCRC